MDCGFFFFLLVSVGDFYILMICKTEWLMFFGELRVDIIPDCLENKYIDGFFTFLMLLGYYDITLHYIFFIFYIGRYVNECWKSHENIWPQTELKCTPCSLLSIFSFLLFFLLGSCSV